MKNKYEIVAMFANDFGKAFDFIRKEMRDECIKVIQTESDIIAGEHGTNSNTLRQRIIDRMRKLGSIE